MQLFIEQAQRIQPDFNVTTETLVAIAQICHLLNGSPLAIELAVGWIRLMTCAQMARALTQNIDLLTMNWSDLPARHRSMRAVFEQSWQQLSAKERDTMERMGVFHGPFTLDAAQSIIGTTPSTLLDLVDKSMVQSDGQGRYSVHELWSQYTQEKLSEDESNETATKKLHATYYANILHRHTEGLEWRSPQQSAKAISADIGNLRAAWQWLIQAHDLRGLERMLIGFWHVHWIRGTEAQESIALFSDAVHTIAQHNSRDKNFNNTDTIGISGALSTAQSTFVVRSGALPEATILAEQGLSQLRQSSYRASPLMQYAFRWLIMAQMQQGQIEAAQAFIPELIALSQERTDQRTEAIGYYLSALCHYMAGNLQSAEDAIDNGLPISSTVGDRYFAGEFKRLRGMLWEEQGRYEDAKEQLTQSLSFGYELNNQACVAQSLHQLGIVFIAQGEYTQAERNLCNAIDILNEIGRPLDLPRSRHALAMALGGQSRFAEAQALLLDVFVEQEQRSHKLEIMRCFRDRGRLAFDSGNYLEAEHLLEQAVQLSRELDLKFGLYTTLPYLGYASLHNQSRSMTEIKACCREAMTLAWEENALPLVLEAIVGMAMGLALEENIAHAIELLTFVQQNPCSSANTKTRATQLLTDYPTVHGVSDLQHVHERADSITLERVTNALLTTGPQHG